MEKSTFKDWKIIYWVDYSNRQDCVLVEDINDYQYIEETVVIYLQFKYIEDIKIEWITQRKYNYLWESKHKIDWCDYIIENYSEEDKAQIELDWFILV